MPKNSCCEWNCLKPTIRRPEKVAIVGAGQVGATFALFTLMQSGLADKIALIDVNAELAQDM